MFLLERNKSLFLSIGILPHSLQTEDVHLTSIERYEHQMDVKTTPCFYTGLLLFQQVRLIVSVNWNSVKKRRGRNEREKIEREKINHKRK